MLEIIGNSIIVDLSLLACRIFDSKRGLIVRVCADKRRQRKILRLGTESAIACDPDTMVLPSLPMQAAAHLTKVCLSQGGGYSHSHMYIILLVILVHM